MSEDLCLAGKVALVTGSSKGIGAGIALEFAKAGADVCINYSRSSQEAERVADQIRQMGRKAVTVQCNVGDGEMNRRMIDTCEASLGPIDILVTNAIASVRRSILETPFQELKEAVETGIYGVFHVLQETARRMVERGTRGSIIHVSSPHARIPFKNAIDYNTAKAGSHHLVLSAANELMWHKIRVNILEPGWTDTPGERQWYSDEHIAASSSKMPLGRIGLPDDLGKAAVFLASDRADYITGAVLKVDGGQTIRGV